MNFQETNELNSFLEGIKPEKKNYTIHIDALRTTYICLEKTYTLPQVPFSGLEFVSIKTYLQNISEFVPDLISNFKVYPYPYPKKDTHKLILLKELEIDNNKYLILLKFDVGYLGGANHKEIKKEASSNYSASIETNRIYFSTRILPITEIQKENSVILGFHSKGFEIQESIIEKDNSDERKIYSVFFDEMDYTEILTPIKKFFKIEEFWKFSKIIEPFQFENLVPSIRFFEYDINSIEKNFHSFYTIFNLREPTLIEKSNIENFQSWLSTFTIERTFTLSKNIAWKIIKHSL
ncbi:MAG: hypothetical protein SFU98_13625 [Leptospiraceae bacterium]|nr:hypothetical protein [Leptospiraceae bacterium]